MNRYKKINLEQYLSRGNLSIPFLNSLSGLNFSNWITKKYNIFRKSANLPALIFIKLFGVRSATKITNINRTESINNYFRLYFNLYPGMISQLERMVGNYNQSISLYLKPGLEKLSLWAKRNNISFFDRFAANHSGSLHDSQVNGFRFLNQGSGLYGETKQSLYSPLANEEKRGLEMGVAPLVFKHAKNISITTPQSRGIRSYFKTGNGGQSPARKKKVSGYPSALEYKSPAVLSHDLLLNNMALFNINKSFLSETFRRTFVVQTSRPSQNASRSGNLMTDGRISLDTGLDNLYFHNRRRIEQEVEEIKKVVIETRETVEKKLLSAHSLKGDMDKYINQHFDITRLSDQVYYNIERRIRMERERRGI